ncbi:H/ACA ribonucleoprotein complex subunit 2-like protein [Liolophura sinensis]|uniref:H/ACA ribonucleoprotein complex subunit 2-like protein n=1 Tax=Liolophura sinensis TaxID=3198878 RepID=UPI0031583116
MGKTKKLDESTAEDGTDDKTVYQEKIKFLSPISQPLASRKLTKKLYKVIKKANKQKQLRKGVREIQKFIRKGENGLVILAGDTNPIEVICHMPLVCEEKGMPYCYTPSKEDLGAALGSVRPTCMVMVKPHDDYRELYDECSAALSELPLPV